MPWLDPADDGVDAQVLVPMESPGPRTVAQGNRGICSEDNDDPTADVLATTRRRVGPKRQDYVRWTMAPWPVLDAEGSSTAPRAADLVQARGPLGDLLDLLPDLRVVVCMGVAAPQGFTATVTTRSPTRVVPVLGVQHPSQRNTRARAEALTRIENALSVARRTVIDPTAAGPPP